MSAFFCLSDFSSTRPSIGCRLFDQHGPRAHLHGGQQQQTECQLNWRTSLLQIRVAPNGAPFRAQQPIGIWAHDRWSRLSSRSKIFKFNSTQLIYIYIYLFDYPITDKTSVDAVASLRLQHSTLQHLQRSARFAQRYRCHLSPSPGQYFHSIYSLYQLKQTDIKKTI